MSPKGLVIWVVETRTLTKEAIPLVHRNTRPHMLPGGAQVLATGLATNMDHTGKLLHQIDGLHAQIAEQARQCCTGMQPCIIVI